MADRYRSNRSRRRKKRSPKRLGLILLFEVLLLVILAGSFYFITRSNRKSDDPNKHLGGKQDKKNVDNDNKDNMRKATPEQEEALKEQERIKQEMAERRPY